MHIANFEGSTTLKNVVITLSELCLLGGISGQDVRSELRSRINLQKKKHGDNDDLETLHEHLPSTFQVPTLEPRKMKPTCVHFSRAWKSHTHGWIYLAPHISFNRDVWPTTSSKLKQAAFLLALQ